MKCMCVYVYIYKYPIKGDLCWLSFWLEDSHIPTFWLPLGGRWEGGAFQENGRNMLGIRNAPTMALTFKLDSWGSLFGSPVESPLLSAVEAEPKNREHLDLLLTACPTCIHVYISMYTHVCDKCICRYVGMYVCT